jgi:hypothetical protein
MSMWTVRSADIQRGRAVAKHTAKGNAARRRTMTASERRILIGDMRSHGIATASITCIVRAPRYHACFVGCKVLPRLPGIFTLHFCIVRQCCTTWRPTGHALGSNSVEKSTRRGADGVRTHGHAAACARSAPPLLPSTRASSRVPRFPRCADPIEPRSRTAGGIAHGESE